MSSYWLDERSAPLPAGRAEDGVDVAVVGAGVTGCSCALALARAGVSVRVHDARTVAAGASGRNGGFALRGGAPAYDRARAGIGRERARQLWLLTERTLDRIEELAGDSFRRTGSLRLAGTEAEGEELRAEYESLREDGFAAEWLEDLPRPLAGRFPAAIRHPRDGAVHPARWVRRLAALAGEAGARFAERSRVESLDELRAEAVVVALDGWTSELVPELARAVWPTRGQVLATEPLPERLFDCPMYARGGYDYWQQTEDRRLVVGGFRDRAEKTEYTAEEETTPFIQAQIEQFVTELLGHLPRITHRWAGIFGMSADRYPLVGRVPGREHVWVAGGYSGHGNVLGFACGELVAGALLDEQAWPGLDLFDPARFVLDGFL
ncbi:MAG: FAD-binding oxidoreductase [Actinomycetota bacterium]|nr:FAD-binding oxidoreductase [Actinomycetota bacterium]